MSRRRLRAQHLIGERCASVAETVGWLGAVQAQDFTAATWALGVRTRGTTEAQVKRLYDDGVLLRTHVLRPTWHFVLPHDVRWMLELTAPRVRALLGYYDRRLELDAGVLKASHAVIARALRGGTYHTRDELGAALQGAGIPATGQRLGHLLMHAELDALLISGPRRGKQFTYALLDDRVPQGRRLEREQALAELTRRYFTSRGPAQAQDFAWWSGLTMADVRLGLATVGSALAHEVIEGTSYWSSRDAEATGARSSTMHLLPNYDELVIAYRDRTATIGPALAAEDAPFPLGRGVGHFMVVNGRVCGSWKRRRVAGGILVTTHLPVRDPLRTTALEGALTDLATFAGMPVRLDNSARL